MTSEAAHSAPRLSVSVSKNTFAPEFTTAYLFTPSNSIPLSPLYSPSLLRCVCDPFWIGRGRKIVAFMNLYTHVEIAK